VLYAAVMSVSSKGACRKKDGAGALWCGRMAEYATQHALEMCFMHCGVPHIEMCCVCCGVLCSDPGARTSDPALQDAALQAAAALGRPLFSLFGHPAARVADGTAVIMRAIAERGAAAAAPMRDAALREGAVLQHLQLALFATGAQWGCGGLSACQALQCCCNGHVALCTYLLCCWCSKKLHVGMLPW